MEPRADSPATALLVRLSQGDDSVSDELLALIYGELRRLAAGRMARERGHTLQPTALVHEAWVRMIDVPDRRFRSRAQFFSLAARAMRSVLVDHARRKGAERRGGGAVHVGLDEALDAAEERSIDFLALEEALLRLSSVSAQAARIVELRFFAGLEHAEIAELLGVSARTVERHWRAARVWLHDELTPPEA
jgi:RNA polymerase sigma factor (TIGR02999 family)